MLLSLAATALVLAPFFVLGGATSFGLYNNDAFWWTSADWRVQNYSFAVPGEQVTSPMARVAIEFKRYGFNYLSLLVQCLTGLRSWQVSRQRRIRTFPVGPGRVAAGAAIARMVADGAADRSCRHRKSFHVPRVSGRGPRFSVRTCLPGRNHRGDRRTSASSTPAKARRDSWRFDGLASVSSTQICCPRQPFRQSPYTTRSFAACQ